MEMSAIRTKLVPPSGRVAILPRPELLDRILIGAVRFPVTLVCAGAGYGKTELAATVHRALEEDRPPVGPSPTWYSLAEEDRDPAVFLLHLATALDASRPGLLDTIRDLLRTESGETGLRTGTGLVINEIFAREDQDVMLVLDDFHEVEDSLPVREGVERLMRHQPPNLHLLICSRRQPELGQLARLRAAGQLLEMDESDLRLTRQETERLFVEIYDLPLGEEALDILHARTDGWLASLQLVQQYLRRAEAGAQENAISDLSGGPTELFDYLGREVLAGERSEIETLLLRASVLDRLCGPLCDAVMDTQGSATLLEEVHRRRLFLHPLDDTGVWYRFHPIFREMLDRQLRAVEDPEAIRALHRRAARWFRSEGLLEDAVSHCLAAGEIETGAELLADLGGEVLRTGRFGQVEGWLDRIPDEVCDEHPWLWLHRGRLAYLRGVGSVSAFDRALDRFEATGDALGVSAARRGKAGALFRLGRYTEAIELAEQALEQLGREHHAERAEVLTLLGICAAEIADLHGAERYLDRALVILRQTGNEDEQARVLHNLATVYHARGEFRRAVSSDQRAVELLPSAHTPLRAAIAITTGTVRRLLGDHDGARMALETLDALHEQLGLQLHRCYALCLEGDICLETGDLESALRLHSQAQGLGHQIGEPSMRVQPWLGLASTHRLRGDLAQAREDAERGVEAARDVGYEWLLGMALNELGAVHLAAGDLVDARRTLQEAAERLEALGSRYELALSRLRQAWLRRGEDGDGWLEPFCECLLLAQAEGYDHLLLRREAAIALPMIAEALAAGVQVDVTTRLLAASDRIDLIEGLLDADDPAVRSRAVGVLRAMGGQAALRLLASVREDPDPDARDAAHHALAYLTDEGPPPLRILTLGGLEVWRGDERIAPGEWGGRRVKDLFKVLVIRRDAPLVRDVILETLWPDLSPETALNNLNVTLSTLRRVLEPWLPPRAASSYILSVDGTYRLNPEAQLDLDVDRFGALAGRALDLGARERWRDTLSACRTATAAYGGELLPENRYDDWTTAERERLANLHADVLVLTIRAWAGLGRLEEACQVGREVLHLQPFSEQVHRTLMRYLARLGRRAEALHQYDECQRAMEGELGVPVSDRTVELHRRIAAGESV